jgi:hypothetical protein
MFNQLPTDLINLVSSYVVQPRYKLLPWIDPHKLDYFQLSSNPRAIGMLEDNPSIVSWDMLSANPSAIHLLEQNPDKINWYQLSKNPSAIRLLQQNPDKIDYCALLCDNPCAFRIINRVETSWFAYRNPSLLDLIEDKQLWYCLHGGRDDVDRLAQHPDNIHWGILSENPAAIHLLEQNEEKINWPSLSMNPAAIRPSDEFTKGVHLLEQHPDKVNWVLLSSFNSKATTLLEKHPDKIDWFWLSANPCIFEEENVGPTRQNVKD